MKIGKFLTFLVACMVLLSCTSCYVKYSTYKLFSEVREDAYLERDDIDPNDKGIYMKTVAGFLTALDDRDKDGIEDLCCEELLEMDGTSDLLETMIDGFRGDIEDTTPLATDLSSREFAQWSADEPVAFYNSDFIVYTDEETYWMSLSLYSVCDNEPDGDDLVGINMIRIMTLDRRFEMQLEANETDGEDHYLVSYSFRDGTTDQMEQIGSCGILVSYGDGSDYIAVNTAKGSSFNVFMLTGTDDEISEREISRIDFSDEQEAYDTIMSYEPYAMGESSSVSNVISHTWLYNIDGSDDKLLVHFGGSDEDDVRITYVRRLDITRLVTDQREDIIYDD
ncbi:MAG: DUF5104 domain-containing protein [Clostridiales bacterium]|nr:DUF5104 domain-containing protein [Clostridiales bacterium]